MLLFKIREIMNKIEKVKYRNSPFIGDTFNVKTKSKQVSIGKNDNIIINQTTGEISATHVITYKQVDASQFIKIFTDNIALTFELKNAGRKVFDMLLRTLQKNSIGKDVVNLTTYEREEFEIEFKVKLSQSVFSRGIIELIDHKILANTFKTGTFFINPNFIFNGDRVAFTNAYEIKKDKPDHEKKSINSPKNEQT